MAKVVNPRWLEEQHKLFVDKERHSVVVSNNVAAKALIMRLVENNISYQVINRGAGVKLITSDVNICPKCGGTGRC